MIIIKIGISNYLFMIFVLFPFFRGTSLFLFYYLIKTMITKTYNINANFTFENICSQLTKFWINEVVKSNYSKIWLTIIIVKKNRSVILIKNLPFNTSEYTDIVIVLKQILETNKSINKDLLNTITFKYSFEKRKPIYNRNVINMVVVKIMLLFTILFIITCIYIMFLEGSQQLYIDLNENKFSSSNEVKEIFKEISSTQNCIFDPFINLFKRSNQCSYIPSYFIPTKLDVKIYDFNLLEYIIHNQYTILDKYTTDTLKLNTELNSIIEQYKTITAKLLEQYQTITVKLLE
jgi:hypothetical protein